MVQRKDLLTLNFYKTTPFTGSLGSLRYRVEKIMVTASDAQLGDSPDAAAPSEPKLLATAWHGPFAFAHTPDAEKITFQADFSEEGLCAVADWLNAQV